MVYRENPLQIRDKIKDTNSKGAVFLNELKWIDKTRDKFKEICHFSLNLKSNIKEGDICVPHRIEYEMNEPGHVTEIDVYDNAILIHHRGWEEKRNPKQFRIESSYIPIDSILGSNFDLIKDEHKQEKKFKSGFYPYIEEDYYLYEGEED